MFHATFLDCFLIGQSGIYTLGYHDYLTDEESREVFKWRNRNVEKNRFEKANKIKLSDWKGEQFFDGNDFFVDLDDFFDGWYHCLGLFILWSSGIGFSTVRESPGHPIMLIFNDEFSQPSRSLCSFNKVLASSPMTLQ